MSPIGSKLTLGAGAIAVIVLSYLVFAEGINAYTLAATMLTSLVAAAVAADLVDGSGRVALSLTKPRGVYGLSYGLYYLVPFLALLYSDELLDYEKVPISWMLLVGYGGFWIGTKVVPQSRVSFEFSWMTRNEARALLIVCYVAIALIVYHYLARAEEGIFFNQARYFELEMTVADSIRHVFGQTIQLPILILLGVLTATPHAEVARTAKRVLWAFGTIIFVVLILSSQTRPAVSAVLFLYLATQFYSKAKRVFRDLVIGLTLCLAAVVVIQGARIVSATGFAEAPNQFVFALENAIPDAIAGLTKHPAELGERLMLRAGATISFLSEVVAGVDARGTPFWGRGVFESLYSLIPRFLWPGKPDVPPPQVVAQEMLNVPVQDASFSPLAQFYFEAGWAGIVMGYILFGAALAFLTSQAIHRRSVGLLMVLAFVWGTVSVIEYELILGILGAVRAAIVFYIVWRCISWLLTIVTLDDRRIGALDGDRRS